MDFKLVFFICFIYICHTVSSLNLRADGDKSCKVKGEESNVICITKTEFVLGFQDPEIDTPYSCEAGEVCADHINICVPEGLMDPACRNSVVDAEGCKSCRPAADVNEPACVSQTQFSLCRGDKLDLTKFPCPASTPYCHAEFDVEGALTSICTSKAQLADCPA